jgi:hypothetical protein
MMWTKVGKTDVLETFNITLMAGLKKTLFTQETVYIIH